MSLGAYIGHELGKYTGGRIGKYIGRKIGHKRSGKRWGEVVGGVIGGIGGYSIPVLGSFKKGGKVKRTGCYLLHKGEKVVPVRKRKKKR